MSNLNFLSQVTAIAPCPVTTGPDKKILLHLSYRPVYKKILYIEMYKIPFYTLKGPIMSPWIILFRLNNSNPLSLSS